MTLPRAGHRSRGILRGSLIAIVLLAVAGSSAALDVPYLGARVNDLALILSFAVREHLEAKLRDLEARTGAQLVVLTILSLEGESLEGYSVKVAQTWKLGRKGVDDGVLFLVAEQDRKMRIEVGYGLEARLTDLLCRRILDEQVRPRFQQSDFDGGIEAGVDALAAVIAGQPLRPATRRGISLPLLVEVFIRGVVVAALLLCSYWSLFIWSFWVPYVVLMLVYAQAPAILLWPPSLGIATLGAWIIAFPILRYWLKPRGKGPRKRHSRVADDRSFSDGGGGGGSSGGTWGGGGFSGGGGGFGGGGASGGW